MDAPSFTPAQVKALEVLLEIADVAINLSSTDEFRGSKSGKAAVQVVEAMLKPRKR